jgi:hypothetical protein
MWVGWIRDGPGKPWRGVCRGDTLDAAHKALLAAVKGQRVRNRDLFLTGGKVPPGDGKK